MRITLADLPDDVLVLIFANVDIDSIFALCLTCKALHSIIRHPSYVGHIMRGVGVATLPLAAQGIVAELGNLRKGESAHISEGQWILKNLVPYMLAIILLDKETLRGHCNVGGLSEDGPVDIHHLHFCSKTSRWAREYSSNWPDPDSIARMRRERLWNGWSVLQRFVAVSRQVYGADKIRNGGSEVREMEKRGIRPDFPRRTSLKERIGATSIYQVASCRLPMCYDHTASHLFRSKLESPHYSPSRKGPHHGDVDHLYAQSQEVRKKEREILKQRLELVDKMKTDDLRDYLLLWTSLRACFKVGLEPHLLTPATKDSVGHGGGYPNAEINVVWRKEYSPDHSIARTKSPEAANGRDRPDDSKQDINWELEVNNISEGCSWLIWFVLHEGGGMFWKQWWQQDPQNSDLSAFSPANCSIRTKIRAACNARSGHQMALERHSISKLELAVRRRCLPASKIQRLEYHPQVPGTVLKTINLDCIPWRYDKPKYHILNEQLILTDLGQPLMGYWPEIGWVRIGPEWWVSTDDSPTILRTARDADLPAGVVRDSGEVLRNCPYLVFLGGKW